MLLFRRIQIQKKSQTNVQRSSLTLEHTIDKTPSLSNKNSWFDSPFDEESKSVISASSI